MKHDESIWRYLSVALAALPHVPLLIFDMRYPTDFVGDRSSARLERAQGFINSLNDSGASIVQYLATNGLVGDYIFQAIPIWIGGKPMVIAAQMVVYLLSLVFLWKLALTISNSELVASITVVTYGLLPHSLSYPHFLVTEAFFNPLIIISFYYLVSYLKKPIRETDKLVISAIFVGISLLIRPVTLMYPLIVVLVLGFSRNSIRKQQLALYLIASFAPLLGWMAFVTSSTGAWSLGARGATLTFNLYMRVERMKTGEHTGRLNIKPTASRETRIGSNHVVPGKPALGISEYLSYVAENPRRFLKALKSDMVNLLLNSGVNKLFGYYLRVYDPGGQKWRVIVEKRGLLAAIQELLQDNTVYVVANISFSIVWTSILLGALAGFVMWARDPRTPASVKILLIAFPLYIICVTLFLAIQFRSGHRSPFEFILCLMFAYFSVCVWERTTKIQS